MASNTKLEKRIKHITTKPGVYFFKDENKKILYIGKAKNLRKRLTSYLKKHSAYEYRKIQALMNNADEIETIVTETEVDALILEAILIKRHTPKYNIALKDDKRYPFIKVSSREDYPLLEVVRNRSDSQSTYFGPFTSANPMRETIKVINQNFMLKKCKKKIVYGKKKGKQCLNYHIGLCIAPCQGNVTKQEYGKVVGQVKLFLSGKYKQLLEDLDKTMKKFSNEMKFEDAARIRNRIESVLKISGKQKMVTSKYKSQDVFGIVLRDNIACVNIMMVREGKVIGQNNFILKRELPYTESHIISEFIGQYYDNIELIPREIILPVNPENKDLLLKMLTKTAGMKVSINYQKTGKLLGLSGENAELKLEEYMAEIISDRGLRGVKKLASILGLKIQLKRIEGFDISNIGASYAVGAMVSFKNGLPDKNNYRRFKIKTVKGQNDFAMIKEIVLRRYKRILNEKKSMPDLILIDGGKGQLNAAIEALKEINAEGFNIISLAKEFEQVYISDLIEPLEINRSSPALKLLQNIRDEAHRFAVSYHRTLRKKGAGV